MVFPSIFANFISHKRKALLDALLEQFWLCSSYRLSVISRQLSVISRQSAVISYQSAVGSYQLSVVSHWLLVGAMPPCLPQKSYELRITSYECPQPYHYCLNHGFNGFIGFHGFPHHRTGWFQSIGIFLCALCGTSLRCGIAGRNHKSRITNH